MYCTACGTENSASSRFCGGCGRPVTVAPVPYTQAPVSRASHFRLLGILWLAESAMRLVPGLALLGLFGAGGALLSGLLPFGLAAWALVWMPALAIIGAILSITAGGGVIAGWGLLNRKPWARTLAIILGLFSLPHVPFGTALGVYTLWVLLPGDSEQEYQAECAARGENTGLANMSTY
jgi:zinc-ribbon domain